MTARKPVNPFHADIIRIRNCVWHRQHYCGCHAVGASLSPSDLACFASNSSSAWTRLPILIRQAHEVWTPLHNHAFRKTKFLSSPSKQLHVIMVVLEPTISTYFSAIDVDSVPQLPTMRFIIHDANSMSKCGSDDAGVAPALALSLPHLLFLTSTTKLTTEKIRLPAEQDTSRLHARISFLLVSWDIDICQRIYRRNYNIHVCCLAGLLNWI